MEDLEIEKIILSSLCLDDNFSRQCLLHLKNDYFQDEYLALFKIIDKHSKEYNTLPNKTILFQELNTIKREQEKDELKQLVNELFKLERPTSKEWLLEKTEEFCRTKAVYNAIVKSLSIYDGTEKSLQPHAIPDLLAEAIAVTFDNSIGMDYLDDAEALYDFLTLQQNKIQFKHNILNKITNGGVTTKTLNILAAAINCFTGDEEIEIFYNTNTFTLKSKLIKMKNLYKEFSQLQKQHHCLYVRDLRDNYTPIKDVITKTSNCIEIEFENGLKRKVSESHRFMDKDNQEVYASLATEVKTKNGMLSIKDKTNIGEQQVFDISIDSPHWYYDQYDMIHHNCGKSLSLVDLAAGYIEQGYNVLYISLEMAEEAMMQRLYANLFNHSMNELDRIGKEPFLSKIQQLKAKNYGKFKVKSFGTDEGHSGHFKALLSELKLKQKFVPEIVIVDYLTICASAKLKPSNDSYGYYKSISAELRAIAQANDLVLWTAIQINRNSQNSSEVSMADIASSIAIAANADFMLGLIRTDELDELGQLKVTQMKNRFSDKTKLKNFILGVDLEKQKLYDVNDDQQTLYSDSNLNSNGSNAEQDLKIAITNSGNNMKNKFNNIS